MAETPQQSSKLSNWRDQLDPKAIGTLIELARAFLPEFGGLGDPLPRLVATPPPGVSGTSHEERLLKVTARFQTLVEQIPAVTFMASFENGCSEIYVSPYIESLLGYTANEWIDNPLLWYQRLHPSDRTRWNKEFAATVSLAKPFKADYRFIAKDGHTVWIHGGGKGGPGLLGTPLFRSRHWL